MSNPSLAKEAPDQHLYDRMAAAFELSSNSQESAPVRFNRGADHQEFRMTPLDQLDAKIRSHYVYPGHPLVLAMQIMTTFPTLESARERGLQYPAALESARVSGAGGEVYSALDIVELITRGRDLDALISMADIRWMQNKAGGHHRAVEPGIKHAHALIPDFKRLAKFWMENAQRESAAHPIEQVSMT